MHPDLTHALRISNYNALRHALDMPAPGYVIHESAAWSDVHNKSGSAHLYYTASRMARWFFLPRRASKHKYDDVEDEKRSTNHMLM